MLISALSLLSISFVNFPLFGLKNPQSTFLLLQISFSVSPYLHDLL